MPLWDNSRYETEAKKIAQTWHGGRGAHGGSLTELVTKIARDVSLNPEQIERLTRITNGHAFNTIFDSAKTAKEKDRYPDFDVADAKVVIAALHESAASPSEMKVASYSPLPDQFEALRARPDETPERMKVASEKLATAPSYELPVMDRYYNLKAASEEIRARKVGAELRWNDSLNSLRKEASALRWNRDEFEYNALALYGADALPEINILRKEAKLAPVSTTSEKVAEFCDRHIGTESRMTATLKVAIEHRANYAKWKAADEVAQEKFAAVRERARASA